jgi:replicative DNA helicase
MSKQAGELSEAHLRLFFAILIQNESIFSGLKSKLTVEHFDFVGYQLVFRVVLDYYNENKNLPSFAEITAEIATYVETGDAPLDDDDISILEEFLEYAFDPLLFGSSGVNTPKLEVFAQKVAQKILIGKLQKSTIATLKTSGVTDMLSIFKEAQSQIESLQSLSFSGAATLTLPNSWDKTELAYKTTSGIGFLDTFLGGGTQKGEAYGIMAPMGAYKTTLGVMLWSLAATRCYTDALTKNNKRKGLSVFVSYEASLAPELQHRLLMYSAQVRRDRLENMGFDGLNALSNDPNHPLDYEKILFKDKIDAGIFEPERTRIQKLIPILNEHAFCLDYSGAVQENAKASTEGVSAIVSGINAELKRRGPEYFVDVIIVDYVGLMVDKDATIPPKQKERTNFTYQQAGKDLTFEVAKRFNCPLWALHQLNGEANAISNPAKIVRHTDAKGAKMFGENLAFCMAGGCLTPDGKGQIACTKHRRAGSSPPVLIQVDGMFNTVSVLNDYKIDRTGKIVHKSLTGDNNMGMPAANSALLHASDFMFDPNEDEDVIDDEGAALPETTYAD